MEKIKTRRTIVKTIEEEVDLELYVSKDGTIFDTEGEALRHENDIDFLTYFNEEYKLKNIDPFEYGLNFGHTTYCHLVYVKKINDKVIDDFIRFYELNDHPDDIIKLKEGWSFVALTSDVNLWVFDKTDRVFIIMPLQKMKEIKKKELNLLTNLI
jgi:hypothetical protein